MIEPGRSRRAGAGEWRRLWLGLGLLTVVIVVGTVGYVLLGFGALDAIYQTVTTVTTVGFREVEPLRWNGQVFTIVLILAGVGTALVVLAVRHGIVDSRAAEPPVFEDTALEAAAT